MPVAAVRTGRSWANSCWSNGMHSCSTDACIQSWSDQVWSPLTLAADGKLSFPNEAYAVVAQMTAISALKAFFTNDKRLYDNGELERCATQNGAKVKHKFVAPSHPALASKLDSLGMPCSDAVFHQFWQDDAWRLVHLRDKKFVYAPDAWWAAIWSTDGSSMRNVMICTDQNGPMASNLSCLPATSTVVANHSAAAHWELGRKLLKAGHDPSNWTEVERRQVETGVNHQERHRAHCSLEAG